MYYLKKTNYSYFFFHLLYRFFFSPEIILHYSFTTTESIHPQGTTTTTFA